MPSLAVHNENINYIVHATEQNLLKHIVLYCHGFPGGNRMVGLVKPLQEHGITMIEARYRGDEGCGGKFSFLGSIEDITVITTQLRKEYPGIPITVLGFSAGGYYTCNIIRKQPNMFDGVVLLNPLLDLSFMETATMHRLWQEAKESLSLHDEKFYADELTTMRRDYHPVDFVSELKPKINMVVSEKDTALPPQTAKQFYDQLPNPGTFRWIPNAPHGVNGDEPEIVKVVLAQST